MPLVQQKIQEHFGKPARKGVHPDECVALGAALLGDSLGQIDSVTLVDVLSMPIGIATPQSRFRRILDKNTTIPSMRSFRLPPPREPGTADRDRHLPGRLGPDRGRRVPRLHPAAGAATGRRIDFKLDEECLLKVSFDDPEKGMTEVGLATRDTPEALRRALAEDARRRQGSGGGPGGEAGGEAGAGEERKGGIFGWLKRGLRCGTGSALLPGWRR